MTQFDLTSMLDRHQKDALAVDGVGKGGNAPSMPRRGFDFIPMWVADMNFATVPSVTEALKKRISHPVYGYFQPEDTYYQAIIDWHKTQHHVHLEKEFIGYENGVLGGVVNVVETFTAPGDAILVHSPTYIGFIKCISAIGRTIITSPLHQDSEGVWRMDMSDMDKKLKQYHIHTVIFCSPHNPCGRVWEKEEIIQAMEVFQKNDCIVISDEIWSDIILQHQVHIPTQSVHQDAKLRTIALYSPSKTFNLAGLVGSYHVVYHSYLRERIRAQAKKTHYNSMNVLSIHALIGAYSDTGRAWVKELNEVLSVNVAYACKFIKDNFLGVTCFQPQGTYMLFLDCSNYCISNELSLDELLQRGWEVGVGWQDGRAFHGQTHIRINLALPYDQMREAFRRLRQYVFL